MYRLFCFSLFIALSIACAQSTSYYYRQLGIKEGLSQSRVQCVLNDHKGYLWVGTESGLNRYDRDHLKQYLHRRGDDTTLPSNNILFVAEDSLSNLWVATVAGICLYDRVNDCFKKITTGDKNLYIASYLLMENGILLAGSGVLYKYEYATKELRTLYQTSDPSGFTPFWEMIRYDKDQVYINTRWHGVYSYQLATGKMERIKYLSEGNYTSIFLDSDKRLWISAYGNGLFCFQHEEVVKHFTTQNSPLSYDVIYDMVEKDNKLWVATDGGGIDIISLNDYSFTNIQQIQDDVHSFPTNALYRLYKDLTDNIWVGSIRGGLIGIKEVYARSYRNVPFGNSYGLSNQVINCFYQDSEGVTWIGTDGGGINSLDVSTGTFKHYPTTRFEKVVSIVEYSPRELLYFSFDKGLFLFNKSSGQIRPFILIDEEMNEKTCINGFSVNVRRISPEQILLSAQHIFLYDITKKEFSIIATMGKEYQRNSPLIITTVGTKTYLADISGICEYDSSNGKFTTIYQGDYTINDACMDSSGIFWLATTVGLVSYDPHTQKCSWIKTNLFNEATSVIADGQQRVWVGTRHNLYIYSKRTENFATLGETDGVLPNEYIFHAMLLAKDGDILVGGTTGMNIIDADIQFDAAENHSIELLDVLLNGLPVGLSEESSPSIETIEVPWNFSSLQLKVLLNEKDVFRSNIFRFHVDGVHQELMQANSNSLVINYLPVGEYTITASYYAQNGEWSPRQKILHIIVSPPWWKTGWAYSGVCLLFALIIYGVFYSIYKQKREKQRREIEHIKDKVYEEKITFLTNISHELRTPLTLICAPLKRIIDREMHEKEIHSQLEPIYKQAYQMKNIIDMVLDVSKLEGGRNILHIVSHPLNEWICSIADRFVGEFEMKGIRLVYELDEEIKSVPFDSSKCEFVLSNFLMNALKFGEPETVTTLITTLSPDKEWIRVAVRDQGIGLKMVDMDSLFTHFYQGTHDKGGSGIGLSYSKSLIMHHKGRIGAIENPDRGATFYYELPLQTDECRESGQLANEKPDIAVNEMEEPDHSFLKSFSILVVEDTVDLRNYLKGTLSDYFAHVYVAKDGKDGLEQIMQRLPDMIVSDVVMPRMNGFELCREVKTNLDISHIPFILLTAYYNSQNMYTGYKTGADGFLPKPFEIDGLLALIHNQLKLREQIKARYRDDKTVTHQEMSFSNADETFLLKLNTLIADNMSNPDLGVHFLALNMCISRSLLFNKVKALSGLGIIDYVNKQRIDKATLLLTTTSMNLTEVSEVVGFSSLRYFSKVFKATKGIIPSAFRKQLEG